MIFLLILLLVATSLRGVLQKGSHFLQEFYRRFTNSLQIFYISGFAI